MIRLWRRPSGSRSAFPAARVFIVALAVLAALAPTPAAWVEHYYSRLVYPALQRWLTPLADRAAFAVFDLLLVAGAAIVLLWWSAALVRAGRARGLRVAAGLAVNTGVILAAGYLAFLGTWGLNYRREPLTQKLGVDRERVTPDALFALADGSATSVNRLYEAANRSAWPDLANLPGRLAAAFDATQQRLATGRTAAGVPSAAPALGWPAGWPVMGRPKVTWLSFYFKRAGVDGMINPFLLEILINGHVLPFERPLVVAHEAAHLAGYADEGEASFIGWLTCLAGDEQTQYSAWLFLLPQTVRYLSEAERGRVYARLDPGPRADLAAVAARLAEAVPLVSRNARRAYDGFLKANRVDQGIASYGTVVDLILGTETWNDR